MIINDLTTTERNANTKPQRTENGDILDIVKFNALPSPVTAVLFGGSELWIESLCVQTGAMRLDVCGQIDHEDFSMVKTLIDSSGNEHEPDDFWLNV